MTTQELRLAKGGLATIDLLLRVPQRPQAKHPNLAKQLSQSTNPTNNQITIYLTKLYIQQTDRQTDGLLTFRNCHLLGILSSNFEQKLFELFKPANKDCRDINFDWNEWQGCMQGGMGSGASIDECHSFIEFIMTTKNENKKTTIR